MNCTCGHPIEGHQHIAGEPRFGMSDLWVCTGSRLADVNAPDFSPYALVCGCVLDVQPASATAVAPEVSKPSDPPTTEPATEED